MSKHHAAISSSKDPYTLGPIQFWDFEHNRGAYSESTKEYFRERARVFQKDIDRNMEWIKKAQ